MDKLTCTIYGRSNSLHLQQIYTGFAMLDRTGAVRAQQIVERRDLTEPDKPPHLRDARQHHLQVVVNKSIKLYYDLYDGAEIDRASLRQTDFYFKRSFASAVVNRSSEPHKVFPLGLNYLVYSSHADRFLRARARLHGNPRERIETILRGAAIDRFLKYGIYTPRVNELHAPPDFAAAPKVLFMARAWNPASVEAQQHKDEICKINEIRAQCIRLLRKEFGARFYGGFAADEYSSAKFSDCLLLDNSLARKRNYLRFLRGFPICVATTGLLGSTGWKMAEYVAYSKAIVCEPLNYSAPGDFAGQNNYLEFSAPENSVSAVTQLFENQGLRNQMMTNNNRYYHAYLKPDALVMRTLAIALGGATKV